MKRSKAAIEGRATDLDASLSLSRSEVASLRTALSQTMASMSAVQSELEATKVDLPMYFKSKMNVNHNYECSCASQNVYPPTVVLISSA